MPNFAEHAILKAARLWPMNSNYQKQHLQQTFTPQGRTSAEVWRPYRESNPGYYRERVVS